MRRRLTEIMPAYAWGMVAVLVLANIAAYSGTRLLNSGLRHYSAACPLDYRIPFVPFFIVFYLLAYAQWAVGFVMIGRSGRGTCLRLYAGELIAKVIALICFLVFPTVMRLRPDVESLQSGGLWSRLTALVYSLDAPDNLFPSIHCLESWFCFRGALRIKRVPAWYAPAMLVTTLLVFASTVLVKQHVLLDVAGGVAAVEAGLAISDRVPFRRSSEEAGRT